MNSNQIRNILQQGIHKKFKTGVYACDQLHNVKSDQFAIIVNSDDSNHKGMHWLAIFKKRNCEIEFFDSFAMPISFYSPRIKFFLEQFSKRVILNTQQVQSNYSNTCGHFSIYYLLHRVRGWSLPCIVQDFSKTNLIKNDEKVYSFVKSNFYNHEHVNFKSTKDNVDVEEMDESFCSLQSSKSFRHICKCKYSTKYQ